ncbi:hypothetical protein ABZ915_23890 [Streptomyces sp. NPDC046915]|uniref:hypothetical protein n=1 Tax=Streptomyces sp. NPDC046915 TaxID=3155257 RepID=UPI0033D80495
MLAQAARDPLGAGVVGWTDLVLDTARTLTLGLSVDERGDVLGGTVLDAYRRPVPSPR